MQPDLGLFIDLGGIQGNEHFVLNTTEMNIILQQELSQDNTAHLTGSSSKAF